MRNLFTGSEVSMSGYRFSSGDVISTDVLVVRIPSGPEAGPTWPEGTADRRKGACETAPAGGPC